MFDVTPDEIASLNDIDLRELVGRLSEAELSSLHELLVKGLYGLVFLHVGATIWHEVVDRVSILSRMVPLRRRDRV